MTIKASLERLATTKERYMDVGLAIMKAAEGKVYPLDFLALAAINRSLHLLPAFVNAITTRNFLVAAPLLRLHVDTCLRLWAAWIVDDCHAYSNRVLEGQHTRKLKDKAGQKMTDAYLVERMSVNHPWIKLVYEACSGFVHLSRTHLMTVVGEKTESGDDGATFELTVGFGSLKLDEQRYIEAVEGFNAASNVLLDLLNG